MRPAPPPLDADELRRYARHLVLPEMGLAGQRRLKGARILVVGAGGLGSPAALYLAAAGVGHLTVVDFDDVDESNLQRQVLHSTGDVGRPKVESARDRLRALNPRVAVDALPARLDAGNALDLVRAHDVVLDGGDNFATRYLVNDACVLAGRPNVHAAVFRFDGQATVLASGGGPCYRCLHPVPPGPGEIPSCAEGGVLGVLPGLLGTIQAAEAIKLVTGIGQPLVGRLLLVDALAMRFRTLGITRNPACPACGTRTIRELREEGVPCDAEVGRIPEVTPAELAGRIARGERLELLDVRERLEWDGGRIPGARLAPLSRLEEALGGLDASWDVVAYCRSGIRSQEAGRRLRAAGFPRVWSLAGGILRWRSDVDPSLERG